MKGSVLTFASLVAFASVAAVPSYETLICHRGESFDAPENTLPAYETAVERGFGFECDIYLSKDGRCFTFHDRDLKRTTAGANTNRCCDVTWDEVSKLDVGGWGKWKGSKFVGTRPALLEEVLALARDGRQIYIEIKTGPVIVPHIKEVLARQTNATPKNVLFITFNAATCAEVKKMLPEYRAYWLTGSKRKTADDSWEPVPAEKVIASCKACQADGVDISFDPEVITEEYVRQVRAAGLEFHVWTIDDPQRAQLAFSRGAQTVTTNCAQLQLEAYQRKLGK